MPKNKKRRNLDTFKSVANLTGFDGGQDTSLDDCLAEFQQSPAQPDASCEAAPKKRSKSSPSWDQELNLDRVESWNRSFLSWAKGGNYTPALLPNIDEELARNFKVQELSTFLLKAGKDIRMPVFERWLLDSKFAERKDSKSRDPVLPLSTAPSSEASRRLVQELQHHGLDSEKAESKVAELCRKTNLFCQELLAQSDRYQRQSPLKKGDRMDLEEHGSTVSLIYARKKWKKPFCFKLNAVHYNKLKARFFEIHNQTNTKLNQGTTKVMHGSHILVLALLLRYSAMSGGQLLQDLRGGGMQGAIHEQVFQVLQSTFTGPWLEGFASPFNMCLPVFGSAFPDTDWHFGSIGSFMDCSFRLGGCCEANPPFSPGMMNGMVDHMETQLKRADENAVSLIFAVVVPTVKSMSEAGATVKRAASESFNDMVSSTYCRKHIRFSAREHGYLEGAQHLRPTKYKESAYDTSVIVLQSQKARGESHDMKRLEEDLKEAFASRHSEELNERRNHAKDD